MSDIGFLGLGAMGFGMAKNLMDAGHNIYTMANRNRQPIERLVSQGAYECADVNEIVSQCKVIILCLPNSNVVQDVIDEMIDGLTDDHLVIDTGTSSIHATKRVHEQLSSKQVSFAEAPLTGGTKQAEAGELGALVGSSDSVYAEIEPILQCFCASVQHFGDVGAGGCAKMANNYMVFGIAALVHEAFHLADTAGVDWAKLYDVVIRGSADSGVFRRMIGNAINDDYKGYVFNVTGAHKDMRYITEMMEAFDLRSPMSNEVLRKFQEAEEQGYGDLMISEILRPEIRKERGGV